MPSIPLGFRSFPIYVRMSFLIPMSGCPPTYQYSTLEGPSLIPFTTISCLILQLYLSADLKVSGMGTRSYLILYPKHLAIFVKEIHEFSFVLNKNTISLSKGELVQQEVPNLPMYIHEYTMVELTIIYIHKTLM